MDYQRLDTRVGDLEASLYGQRSYAQAITNVSASLAQVATSLSSGLSTLSSGVSTSLSSGLSTLSTHVSSSLSSGLSALSAGVSSSLSSGLSTLSTGVSTSLSSSFSSLLNTNNTWTAPQEITALAPQLVINTTTVANRNIQFWTNGSARWGVQADFTAESGSNVGSDFEIFRNSDAGAFIDSPLKITRSTGLATFADNIALTPSAFASLPGSPTAGQRAFINNSNVAASGNFGAAAAGGGGNTVPVYWDGATWRIG